VLAQKGIDELAQHFFVKKGIFAMRRVKKSDMERLSRATGAKVISNIDNLQSSDLGEAEIVEETLVGDEKMTFVRGCKHPKSVTILIRGGTEHVVDEAQRAIEDSIGVVVSCIKNGKIVAGAGSTEIELAMQLRQFAETLSGREQLAVKAFADSMEIVPRTLSENAGLDPIDMLTELKSAHKKNKLWAGIDVFSGKVMDSWSSGVIEPLKIKTQALSSATEVSTMILRIDDVIASKKEEPKMPPDMKDMGM
jgi:chaperonin GroEL (HSP60 family)